MRFLGLLLLLTAGAAQAGEYAVMAGGARLSMDRHEIVGTHVRLYNSTGYIEMPASSITAFEIAEEPATAPPPTAAAPVAPAAIAPPPPSPVELADAAADKYGLPRVLVRSVMAAESAYQQDAVSPKGAIGLMQLMPGTAQDLGVDPHDAAQNVDAGVRYLHDLLVRYDWELHHALAAYNAGPGAVDKYQTVPPYRETINYVNRIDRALETGLAPAPPEQQQRRQN